MYIYIASSHTQTLYIGVTNDLRRRMWEHKEKQIPGFTAKYNVTRLVYFEETNSSLAAIEREKVLKGWLRAKKISLIESQNPHWNDLAVDWYE
ncbi:MAG: GIY-YIG nuclease family protein [Candidatus Saccharibacteria bacterium]